jgi:hypothetical protein
MSRRRTAADSEREDVRWESLEPPLRRLLLGARRFRSFYQGARHFFGKHAGCASTLGTAGPGGRTLPAAGRFSLARWSRECGFLCEPRRLNPGGRLVSRGSRWKPMLR